MSEASQSGTQDADQYLVRPDSERMPTISVVLPTKNEAEGVRECIDRTTGALETLGVTGEIIVSDSSDDGTARIATELGARVVSPDAPGYGYAYRYAFERVRGDYVVMGDADTTYDFGELPSLVRTMNETGADIVLGSRLAGDIEDGAMPLHHRYVGNPLLTRFLNAFYDAGVSDAHSGFRVLTREALERLDMRSDGMEFASEMLMAARAEGLEIAEVPIMYRERTGEATLDSFRDGWRHVKFMLVNAPTYLFLLPGLVMGLFGLVVMALGYTNSVVFGQPIGIHSLVAGCLSVLVGYQVATFGVLTELAVDPIRRPSDRVTNWILTHFTLERGVGIGLTVFFTGATVATVSLYTWYRSGFVALPSLSGDVVAFTAIVLGIQTVFWSFFASALTDL